MSNATVRTVTTYNGNEVDIVIEAESLAACLEQLSALHTDSPAPAAEAGNAGSPEPEAPAATTSAPQTSSEPATAPATDATPSATSTAEPASEPAAAEEPAAPKAEGVISGEEVLAAAKKLLTSGPEGEPKLKEALAAVGATTVGTCPAEKRADLLAAINEKLGA